MGSFIFLKPVRFIHWYLLLKPAIDQGMSFLGAIGRHAGGVALPVFTLLYALLATEKSFRPLPFKTLIALYIFLYIIAFVRFGHYQLDTLGLYLRALLPPLLYFSIPVIVGNRQNVEKLIYFSAISGLAASSLIVLQFLGVIDPESKKEMLTIGEEEILRITGGFFDAFSASLPVLVSIICLLFIIQTRKKKLYWAFLGINIFAVFLTVHRMSTIVLAVILMMWIIMNKKTIIGLLAAVILAFSLPILSQFAPAFFGDVKLVKEQKATVISNESLELSAQALHGRGWLWASYLKRFGEASSLDQIFGIKTTGRGPHNDYLRILMNLGLFGLAVYLIILALIGSKLVRIFLNARSQRNEYLEQLALTAIFFWVFCILGSMTLAVGLLSTLMWYFWMFAGLAFMQHYYEKNDAVKSGS